MDFNMWLYGIYRLKYQLDQAGLISILINEALKIDEKSEILKNTILPC